MKYYTAFVLCFLLPIIFCDELGGVKVAINEKFISNLIRNFEPDLKKVLDKIPIPDGGGLEDGEFGVPNFNLNMIKLEFLNNGILHLRIQNCTPYFSGSYHYKILWVINSHNNFNAKFNDFVLDARIRIKSRHVSGGGYGPDIEFISGPDISFDLDVSCDGFLHGVISWVINKCQGLIKPFILPKIKSKAIDSLKDVLKKLETKVNLGNNYWLDFTLVSPIKTQNGFLELNSYAFFYNEKNALTKNRNKYPLTLLPSINTLGKNLQLYVSEYSINNAIYTLLSDSNKVIPIKVNTKILNTMLPGILDKYGEKEATIILNGSPESKIQITDQYMHVQVPGTFSVKIDGIENEVFKCTLDLSLKVNVKVADGPKLSGEIKELSGKIKTVNLNNASNSVNSVIEGGFALIQSTIIPVLNLFIQKNIEIKFPTVMGISFTNVSLELKNKYFVVNYDITRNNNTTQQGRKFPNICDSICQNPANFRKPICAKCKSRLPK